MSCISASQVKRRNMERLVLCCGGNALNSVYDMTETDLGYAGEVGVLISFGAHLIC